MGLAFTDEDRAKIDEIVARYPNKPAALLPVLHIVQDNFGHLSPEVQLLVAQALDVPPPRVREVVTFYEMYHEHPEGQFHIEVCTNISCHLMGGDAVLDHLRSKLGIECGQHTKDNMFSLMEAECLASCGSGVTLKVGRDYYEHLTVEAVDALVDRFKKMAPELKGKAYVCGKDGPHVGPVKGFEPPAPKLVAAPTKKAPAKAAAKDSKPAAEAKDAKPAAKADKGSQDLPSFNPPPLNKNGKK